MAKGEYCYVWLIENKYDKDLHWTYVVDDHRGYPDPLQIDHPKWKISNTNTIWETKKLAVKEIFEHNLLDDAILRKVRIKMENYK